MTQVKFITENRMLQNTYLYENRMFTNEVNLSIIFGGKEKVRVAKNKCLINALAFGKRLKDLKEWMGLSGQKV